jgi:hypothetical protein
MFAADAAPRHAESPPGPEASVAVAQAGRRQAVGDRNLVDDRRVGCITLALHSPVAHLADNQ